MSRLFELKAKASVKEDVHERVRKLCKHTGASDVTDFFFGCGKFNPPIEIRMRKEGDGRAITMKVLRHRNGMQENDEYKFEVDNIEDFTSFLEVLGFEPSAKLKKRIEHYEIDGIKVNYVTVERLGTYVEFKLHDKKPFEQKDRDKIMNVAEKLGLKESQLDSRFYCTIASG